MFSAFRCNVQFVFLVFESVLCKNMNIPNSYIKLFPKSYKCFDVLGKTVRPSPILSSHNNKLKICFQRNGMHIAADGRYFEQSSNSRLHCQCISFIHRRVTIPGSVLSTTQKRNFSLKETFDSAIVFHTAAFKFISESSVVECAQNVIIQFHDTTGLPWWLSIIMTTCLIRTVLTLPLAIYQNHVVARLENARKEMEDIVNDIKYELNREVRRNKWPERTAQRYFRASVRKEWTRLIERDNCHPAKAALLALVQIPLWLIFSTAFRNLVYKLPYNDTVAQLKCLELSVGGVAWFPDLTVADSIIIPITLGLVNLSIVEIQSMMHKGQRTRLQRYVTNFFRGFCIFMIPVSATVPSCLTLYWVTSSTFGLCQNLALMSPRVRRLTGIPPTPSSHSHPYTHLVNQLKDKFRE